MQFSPQKACFVDSGATLNMSFASKGPRQDQLPYVQVAFNDSFFADDQYSFGVYFAGKFSVDAYGALKLKLPGIYSTSAEKRVDLFFTHTTAPLYVRVNAADQPLNMNRRMDMFSTSPTSAKLSNVALPP